MIRHVFLPTLVVCFLGCTNGNKGDDGGTSGTGGGDNSTGGGTGTGGGSNDTDAGRDGPPDAGPEFPRDVGDADAGRNVFRFTTFGNEGFWTDAMRLQQGIVAANLTPVQALQLGLSVNVDALDDATKAAVAAELADAGTSGPLLNDPATTLALINANAVIGVVVKDTNGDGMLNAGAGDKVGVACALCHAITDGSVVPSASNLGGGSIGKEIDGPTPHNLNVGKILAAAANSRAYFPLLQVRAASGASIGRAPASAAITPVSTEEEVDAYLSNPAHYPLGSFDDARDGTGAPQHIVPFFRTDLSAPFGTPGDVARLENFNNLVYTVLLDPTSLVLPNGRNFLKALGGAAGGTELADGYRQVLTATGVIGPNGNEVGAGFPFVEAADNAATAGSESAPVGLRVDSQMLAHLNAYTDSLRSPSAPANLNQADVTLGRSVFRQQCTACHNVSQAQRVPSFVVPMNEIFPAYAPMILAQRPIELPFRRNAYAPIQDDPSTIFDDKTVIVEASRRGEVRGSALPLLMDLARKDRFLHDSSVVGLSSLVDPSRGSSAPHPFFVADEDERRGVVEFLKSLDDSH